MPEDEEIFPEDEEISEESEYIRYASDKCTDREVNASYIITMIFLVIFMIMAVALVLKPELAENTGCFIKDIINTDISGITKRYIAEIKNVFV